MKKFHLIFLLLAGLMLAVGCSDNSITNDDNKTPTDDENYSPMNLNDRTDEHPDCLEAVFMTIQENLNKFSNNHDVVMVFPDYKDNECLIVVVVTDADAIDGVKLEYGDKLGDFKLVYITLQQMEDIYIPDCFDKTLTVLEQNFTTFYALDGFIMALPGYDETKVECYILLQFDNELAMNAAKSTLGDEIDGVKLVYELGKGCPPWDSTMVNCDEAWKVLEQHIQNIVNTEGVADAFVGYYVESERPTDPSEFECVIYIIVEKNEYLDAVKAKFGEQIDGIKVLYEVKWDYPEEFDCEEAWVVVRENYEYIKSFTGVIDVYADPYFDWKNPNDPGDYDFECVIYIIVDSKEHLEAIKAVLGETLGGFKIIYDGYYGPGPNDTISCELAEKVLSENYQRIMDIDGVVDAIVSFYGSKDGSFEDPFQVECVIMIFVETYDLISSVQVILGDEIDGVKLIYKPIGDCPYPPDDPYDEICKTAVDVMNKYYREILSTEGVYDAMVGPYFPEGKYPDDPSDWGENCAIYIILKDEQYLETAKARWGDLLEDVVVQYEVWFDPDYPTPDPEEWCVEEQEVFDNNYERIMAFDGVFEAILTPYLDNKDNPSDTGFVKCVIIIMLESEEAKSNVYAELGDEIEGVELVYEVFDKSHRPF